MISTDENKIKKLLSRGVEQVFVKEHLEQALRSGKQLRVKLGIDPTGAHIHIGRATLFKKLKEFQDLGHKIVFIIGDFTAQIGDPSDKLSKRPMLTKEVIEQNLETYKEQIGKIVDLDKAEYHYNSQWLSKLTFADIASIAETFSVQQMLSRRNFKDRYEKGEEISLREFMYPLMQGYDSVMIKADVELGGFDQLFNIKAGRTIQKHYGMAEQDVMATTMLEGTDGRKMSTSWGNVININDQPNDMFGKVMSLRDDLIEKYFLLITDVSDEKLEEIKKRMASDENPRDIKLELAYEITFMYHNKEDADEAQKNFIETFQKGSIPEDIQNVTVSKGSDLSTVLLFEGLVTSKTEFRRLVDEGAIKNIDSNGTISDHKYTISSPITLKIGKRRFIKISLLE